MDFSLTDEQKFLKNNVKNFVEKELFDYAKDLEEKDDKSIVIDELVGIWIALMPAIYFADIQSERTIIAILALILFRVFDILKPFPISYFDQRFKNGFGIVIDDVIAGIITLLILIPLSLLLF